MTEEFLKKVEAVYERSRTVRFSDIDELLIARVLLSKSDATRSESVEVVFDLSCLFTTYRSLEEVEEAARATAQLSDRLTETVTSVLSSIFSTTMNPATTDVVAWDYYVGRVRSRLQFLRDGDDTYLKPMIESFSEGPPGTFKIWFRPSSLRDLLSVGLGHRLDLVGTVSQKLALKIESSFERIDYRKELDLLRRFLDERHQRTGERSFSFRSDEIPFRHAFQAFGAQAVMAAPGTCGPSERILLPLMLEAAGQLDIDNIGIVSPAEDPKSVVFKYAVRFPSSDNVYERGLGGLSSQERRQLSEIQLSKFDAIHRHLSRRYVFLERPELETSFAAVCSWFLKKVDYCLQEPTFLARPAKSWLDDHAADGYTKFEDDFFLPFLHERLSDAFGGQVLRKPERFGGEVDLLVSNLPIELKARKKGKPLTETVDESYRPVGQAAAYAASVRVGIVAILDFPDGDSKLSNFDSCVRTVERVKDSEFPTCIVVFIFHCHHPKPSSVA
jgi:hypothetical protein